MNTNDSVDRLRMRVAIIGSREFSFETFIPGTRTFERLGGHG